MTAYAPDFTTSGYRHSGRTVSPRSYFTPPAPEKRTITYGDRIFVRLTMTTGESMEFYVTTANGMSELLGEVRRRARHLCGLGKIWIRNMSWGWSTDRPIRLYGSNWPSPAGSRYTAVSPSISERPMPARHHLGPWDTH